jgi:hypothetical protein
VVVLLSTSNGQPRKAFPFLYQTHIRAVPMPQPHHSSADVPQKGSIFTLKIKINIFCADYQSLTRLKLGGIVCVRPTKASSSVADEKRDNETIVRVTSDGTHHIGSD